MIDIDTTNKYLSAAQGIVVILGLGFAAFSLQQLATQTRIQNETLAADSEASSAQYVLNMEDRLSQGITGQIDDRILYGDQNTPVIDAADGGAGGPFNKNQVEDYLGNFEDIGMLVRDGVISQDMAFNDFSDEIEMAWCNKDIQNRIKADRSSDHTTSAQTNPYWSNFEYLATSFLNRDGGCKAIEM